MDLSKELEGLFGANIPLLHVVTYEEQRVIQAILELKPAAKLGVYAWDVADNRFIPLREGAPPFAGKEANTEKVLQEIAEKAPPNTIFVLKDFHHSWVARKPQITRKLRNMAPDLRARNQFLVLTTPVRELPIELKDDVVTLDVPLPDTAALTRLFAESTAKLDRSAQPREDLRGKLITSALGLTTNQARLAFSRVYATYEKYDERGIDIILSLKQQVIRESGALEFWPAAERASVGGLDLMQSWLAKIEKAFSVEAASKKIPRPRGVALIGIPGTGKSLSAKMLSGMWKLPLLRLDMGAVFGSLLGEAEANIRKATRLADTVSPCILWIDEMEKAFAGAGPGSLNSGAPTRVFGTFLTWMQEHTSPVFVLATANDISSLDAALMSRFNRTFFLDLPTAKERREIFNIHLKRAGLAYPEQSLRVDELVGKTRGWVGREIERAVHEAQFIAFADDDREIEQADLDSVIAEIIPIEQSHRQVIEQLRKWKTEGHAFPASSEERAAPAGRGRLLESN